MSKLTLEQELAALRAENEALKTKANKPISFKISEKGGVSIYGINTRFPVTLYREQWQKLMAKTSDLDAFMLENKAALDKVAESFAAKKA